MLTASIAGTGAALGVGNFAVTIAPAAADASKAVVSGPGVSEVSTFVAGTTGRVTIASRDRFGNSRAGRYDTFAYSIAGGGSGGQGRALSHLSILTCA